MVQPDVISAEKALKTAHLFALKGVLAKTTDQEFIDELNKAIETVKKELAGSIKIARMSNINRE